MNFILILILIGISIEIEKMKMRKQIILIFLAKIIQILILIIKFDTYVKFIEKYTFLKRIIIQLYNTINFFDFFKIQNYYR